MKGNLKCSNSWYEYNQFCLFLDLFIEIIYLFYILSNFAFCKIKIKINTEFIMEKDEDE